MWSSGCAGSSRSGRTKSPTASVPAHQRRDHGAARCIPHPVRPRDKAQATRRLGEAATPPWLSAPPTRRTIAYADLARSEPPRCDPRVPQTFHAAETYLRFRRCPAAVAPQRLRSSNPQCPARLGPRLHRRRLNLSRPQSARARLSLAVAHPAVGLAPVHAGWAVPPLSCAVAELSRLTDAALWSDSSPKKLGLLFSGVPVGIYGTTPVAVHLFGGGPRSRECSHARLASAYGAGPPVATRQK